MSRAADIETSKAAATMKSVETEPTTGITHPAEQGAVGIGHNNPPEPGPEARPGAIAAVEVEQVKVRVLPDGRMTREDTARYIGVEVKTLSNWALVGRGPPAVKIAGRAFYYLPVVDAYIREQASA